jgi:hypothetical protein
MKVADLKVGKLYKVRSDRPVRVSLNWQKLDIHIGHPGFNAGILKMHPMTPLLYLGQRKDYSHGSLTVDRWVTYRGKQMPVYPNIWQHIRELTEE